MRGGVDALDAPVISVHFLQHRVALWGNFVVI